MKKPRTFTKADGVEAGDLLHCGEDHLSAAESLFSASPSFYDSAGYLAHMGFELLLKSWLLEAAGEFPRIHRISGLWDTLMKSHGAPALTEAESKLLTKLDQFETLRYPNRKAPTEVGTEDWKMVDAFSKKLRGLMPQSIEIPAATDNLVRKSGRVLMKKKMESTGEPSDS
jgi:HEPN domain-containing protein